MCGQDIFQEHTSCGVGADCKSGVHVFQGYAQKRLVFCSYGNILLLVLLTNVRVIYIILATIIIAIVAARIKQVYDKKILHSVGTAEYFNERIGRTLEKDEYVRETALYQPILIDKTIDFQNINHIASSTHKTKNGKEDKIK